MNEDITNFPESYKMILEETNELGFEQLSDLKTGSLLSTLCASKVNGLFLELGTGTGLCTSWMLHGMSSLSKLITVDTEQSLVEVAKKHLAKDSRVEFVTGSGEELIERLEPLSVDLIFADTWPGKYNKLEEALSLLKIGGIYVIDDMLSIKSWPESHARKVLQLEADLTSKKEFTFTKLCWSTGVMVGVKQA